MDSAGQAVARPRLVVTTRDLVCVLFVLLVLISTYDKSGVPLRFGGREISVSLYKILFLALTMLFTAGCVGRPTRTAGRINRRLYHVIIAFVVIQTLASLAGLFVAPGEIVASSEVYYLIQRAHFLVIPMVALRYRIAPRTLLKLFVGAVLIHMLFIGVQFGAPGVYRSFVEYVRDPLRLDVTEDWDGQLSYIGLQRTGNYGAFAAAFGLLALAFSPGRFITRALKFVIVSSAVVIALTSSSRAVAIMAGVALLAFWIKGRALSRRSTYMWAAALLIGFIGTSLFVTPRVESLRSVYAFVDPEKEGSTIGKYMIADYGLQLFARSPIVGWGQRRFANISAPLGNSLSSTSETHSYMLSTLLGTGLVGLTAYGVLFIAIMRRLWRRPEKDYAIVAGMFLGLGAYSVVYDAGGLDVFALFNGVAACYALTSRS